MPFTGEPILSGVLQGLSNKLVSPVVDEFVRIYGVKDELQRLWETLKDLQAMLRDAERRQIEEETLQEWLRKLKTVAGRAEDVVDEFEYEALKRRIEGDGDQEGCLVVFTDKICQILSSLGLRQLAGCFLPLVNKVRHVLSPLNPSQLLFRRDMARKIHEINKSLDDIKSKGSLLTLSTVVILTDGLGSVENRREVIKKRRDTTSLLKNAPVFGREKYKEDIIKFLLTSNHGDPSSSFSDATQSHYTKFSVVVIVGIGGLGKTTLAQQVYNDDKVEGQYFDERMWVCASKNVDVNELIDKIYKQVVKPQETNQPDRNTIQVDLKKKLKGKRFLLVVDDVWEDMTRKKWEQLCGPLSDGEKSSKVVVTTRIRDVANKVTEHPGLVVDMEGLEFNHCWSIFKHYANFNERKSREHPGLVVIGKQIIVEKLKGNPLAVSTVGGLLYDELDQQEWRRILTSEMWKLKQKDDDILPALRLSYEYLPTHLNQCFVYCSLFPKDHPFEILDLVKLWMAQGFIQNQSGERIEDIGREYFNELLGRSFFQIVNGRYVIHDLLHDLAQSVSGHEYITVETNELQDIPETNHHKIFHLRLECHGSEIKDLKRWNKSKSFRSLLLDNHCTAAEWHAWDITRTLFDTLSDMFRCLRCLSLRGCDIESLPDSIGDLKHLRYLDLQGTRLHELPESLCCLYHLQTLKLFECGLLRMLPEGTSRLVNLRHLEVRDRLFSQVVGIGKLTRLQKLYDTFDILEGRGSKMGELKDMNELGGELHIQNLRTLESREEADRAQLSKKQYLKELRLEWATFRCLNQIKSGLEEAVLESLRPPPNLKELVIEGYGGVECPSWMETGQSLSNILESIRLWKCCKWNSLPSLERLRFLRRLWITSCPELKKLPLLPKSLRDLTLEDVGLHALPALWELPLHKLKVLRIPELRELPLLPTTLRKLKIQSLPSLNVLRGFQGHCHNNNSSCSSPSPLSKLRISDCPKLTSLGAGLRWHHLTGLQLIEIQQCEELEHWPKEEEEEEEGGSSATLLFLEKFVIRNCPKLMPLPVGRVLLSPLLKELVLKDCPGVLSESLFLKLPDILLNPPESITIQSKLASCFEEALRHLTPLPLTGIKIIYAEPAYSEFISLYCNKPWFLPSPELSVYIKMCSSLLISTTFLRNLHVLVVREFEIGESPERTPLPFLAGGEEEEEEVVASPRPFLTSLEEVYIWSCQMTSLPMSRHLAALKTLRLNNCPEVTWVGFESLVSLRELDVVECPKLVSAMSSAKPPPSPPPPLQKLTIDDTSLLRTTGWFARHYLTSIKYLKIYRSDLTSFTSADEEGLQSLSSSLRCLEFDFCNLCDLPAGLWSLTSLERLEIRYCPEIRCLPEKGLPPSLQTLFINGSSELERRCRYPPSSSSSSAAGGITAVASEDWHRIAHIPNIEINYNTLRRHPSTLIDF